MMSTSASIRYLISSSTYSAATNVIGQLLGLCAVILMTRVAGADAYGQLAASLSIMMIIQYVLICGCDRSALKYVSEQAGTTGGRPGEPTSYGVTIISGLSLVFLAGLLFVIHAGIELAWGGLHLDFVTFAFLLVTPVLALFVYFVSVATALGSPVAAQFANGVIRFGSQAVLFLLLLYFIHAKESMFAAVGASYGIGLLFLLWAVNRKLRKPPTLRPAPKDDVRDAFRTYLKFSLIVAPIPLLNVVNQQVDTLLVAYFLDYLSTGYFAVVKRVVAFGMLPLIVAGTITSAHIGRLVAGDERDSVVEIYWVATKYIFLVTLVGVLFLLSMPREILLIFDIQDASAVGCLELFALTLVVRTLFGPAGSTLLIIGKERVSLAGAGISIILFVVLAVICIPAFGLAGAAIAFGCTYLIVQSFLYRSIRAEMGSVLRARVLISRLLLASSAGLVCHALNQHLEFLPLKLACVALVVLLFGGLYLRYIERFSAPELAALESLVGRGDGR